MKVVLIISLLVLLASTFLETKAKVRSLKEYVYNVELSVTPPRNPGPNAVNIKLLSSVLGSEKAAKKAYLWAYDISGFIAKLTPEQAKRLKELWVVKSVKKDALFYPPDDDSKKGKFVPSKKTRRAKFTPQEGGF